MTSRIPSLTRVGAATLGWLVTSVACPVVACPVCFAAEQHQLWAYFATAVLLSVLPFLLFGVGAIWIYRERRRAAPTIASAGLDETPVAEVAVNTDSTFAKNEGEAHARTRYCQAGDEPHVQPLGGIARMGAGAEGPSATS